MTTTQVPTFDTAYEQAKELNEQFLAAARKAGNLYVDAYEKAVERALDLELKVAGTNQQEWVRSLIENQADLTRQLTGSYTAAARALLK